MDRRLGTMTAFGLGTAPLGGLFAPVSDGDAQAVLEAAWDGGLRYFDTAPLYGFGLAERRLGTFLRGKPRDSFVLSTKVGRLLRPPAAPAGDDRHYKVTIAERPVFDFSHDGVLRSFEESLKRLGIDRIDILLIHDPDDHADEAIAGAYRALDRLRREGVITALGAGMNQSAIPTRFAREGRFDLFLLAGRYSLLDQSALDDLLPVCAAQDIAVVIGGVYNSGILADPKPGTTFDYEAAPEPLVARAQRLADLCRNHNVSLKAAALRFPTGHRATRSILLGPRTARELADSLAAARESIPEALWEAMRADGLIDRRAPIPSGIGAREGT